jgi:hypothetical protein
MAAASTLSPKGIIKRQTPRQLGAVMLLFDVAMLITAFFITKKLSAFLVTLSTEFDWSTEFHHFDTRRYYYLFLCFCILVRFVVKGHYSRRPPWLGQVEGIFKTIGFAALFDCFNFYFLDYKSFPTLILFNWSLCAVLLVLGRYVSIFLISHSKNWRLPIVLVGDSRMVMDSFYAFYADGLTGYEVKVVLLTESYEPDFNLGFLPRAHPYVELRPGQGKLRYFYPEQQTITTISSTWMNCAAGRTVKN